MIPLCVVGDDLSEPCNVDFKCVMGHDDQTEDLELNQEEGASEKEEIGKVFLFLIGILHFLI